MLRGAVSFLRDDRAAAASELALILPMAFALMFTTFEGGAYLWIEHKVVKGVRDGARYAARLPLQNATCLPSNTSPTKGSWSAVTDTTMLANIQRVTRTGNPVASAASPRFGSWTNNVTVTVHTTCDPGVTSGIYSGVAGGGRIVRVSADVPYPSILGNLGFFANGAIVHATAQAAVVGL